MDFEFKSLRLILKSEIKNVKSVEQRDVIILIYPRHEK